MTTESEENAAVRSPALRRYRDGFLAFKDEADAVASDLSREAFNRPPAPGKWSVGQCLDHLNEAGRLLVPRLEEAIRAAPACPSNDDTPPRYGLFERLFIWLNGPRGWLKMPSPGAYRPAEHALDPAVAAFKTLQDDLAACAAAADGLDVTAVRITSPASRFVRLSLGAWLEATLAHQHRHLQQARDARQAIGR